MGRYSPNADWAAHHTDAPALSVIVAVDTIDDQTRHCLDDVLKVVRDSSCEVLVASREIWPDPPLGLTVVSCASDSRGVRFDRAAWRARGRILAFLDDGVCLPEGWPQRVIEFFDDPNVAIAGGPVLPRTSSRADRVGALSVRSRLVMTRMRNVSPSDRTRFVAELTEPNVLIRKDVFQSVGGFRTLRTGGETMRVCHAVRSLGFSVHYHPNLAVVGRPRRFPEPFIADTAAYGRARGEMARESLIAGARRFTRALLIGHPAAHGHARGDMPGHRGYQAAAPSAAFAASALAGVLVFLELALAAPFTPFRHLRLAEYVGATLLLVLFLIQVPQLAFVRGPARIEDQVLATLCIPLVSATYGVAFVLGFFDTRQRP